jgi:hypothetical protein
LVINPNPAAAKVKRPTQLTKELYNERADKFAAIENHPDARNVNGKSELCRLPYFDIVKDTLIDMMHITSGIMGRNLIAIACDRLSDHSKPPTGVTMPSAEARKKMSDEDMELLKLELYLFTKGTSSAHKMHACCKRYRLGEARIGIVEAAYHSIQAPPEIAPRSKYPLRRSGEMTAYHWLNIARVTGKYLFSKAYPQGDANFAAENKLNAEALQGMCLVIDVLASCLLSFASAAVKANTDALVSELAKNFEKLLPQTEQTMNMHLLMHHIPATIRRWGPSRGFHCFPFER